MIQPHPHIETVTFDIAADALDRELRWVGRLLAHGHSPSYATILELAQMASAVLDYARLLEQSMPAIEPHPDNGVFHGDIGGEA